MTSPRKPGIRAFGLAACLGWALLATPVLAQAQTSCTASIGAAKAKVLVERCLNVSPATRPPCNAANSCALIQDEIARGCVFLGKDAPAYCPKT